MSFKLRIVNAVFWIAVWITAVVWTGFLGNWFMMFLESIIPIMMWLFIHIALRPHPPEA